MFYDIIPISTNKCNVLRFSMCFFSSTNAFTYFLKKCVFLKIFLYIRPEGVLTRHFVSSHKHAPVLSFPSLSLSLIFFLSPSFPLFFHVFLLLFLSFCKFLLYYFYLLVENYGQNNMCE